MPPSDKPTIQITILDDRHTEECTSGCTMDWSLPVSLTLARQQVRERFGNKVRLEYINMSMDTSMTMSYSDVAGWKAEIRNKNLLLPLLLVNGQLRISGPFDFRQLMDAIEFELEIKGVIS